MRSTDFVGKYWGWKTSTGKVFIFHVQSNQSEYISFPTVSGISRQARISNSRVFYYISSLTFHGGVTVWSICEDYIHILELQPLEGALQSWEQKQENLKKSKYEHY